ncbi:hypothetical protein K493DRAFT_319738 [Basidiobolus meristosporus CBS 931.73]|uniref:Uncharacterized protein n=1 Tax=Basidiobolus meristosporus CBS 931.73 TaxID=1314790 RepID=A0A1Y1XMB3_9FUNG|nr:hypothetical protein K493DRAFT_319738 [Basidiobolus meristosporus CBS 931.73]|eukprot:ORX86861.1 hypothetical protein K493DRAFT_319738 [Basidiobolus meristosporus CBS 931.73]
MPSASFLSTPQQLPSPLKFHVSSPNVFPPRLNNPPPDMAADYPGSDLGDSQCSPPTDSAPYYEDVYYHLYAISQKKLVSITESRIDLGVRKAVLINNLFRTLPPSAASEMIMTDSNDTDDESESVPSIDMEEQSWFDSCLEDLHDDDDDFDNSDDEMEWSWSSGNVQGDSFMDYDHTPQNHSSPCFLHQSKEGYQVVGDPRLRSSMGASKPGPKSLATSHQEKQAYLSRYFCRDGTVPSNEAHNSRIWSGNSGKFSLGCYSNHLFYL